MEDFALTAALAKKLGGGGEVDPAVIEGAVNDWLDDHPEATTTVEDGAITKAKLDSSLQETVDDVAPMRTELSSICNEANVCISGYLYKSDTYINSSGVETSLTGYNLYKIPVNVADVVWLEQIGNGTKFWDALNVGYVVAMEKSDHTYVRQASSEPDNQGVEFDKDNRTILFLNPMFINLVVCVKGDLVNTVFFRKNAVTNYTVNSQIVAGKDKYARTISSQNAFVSKMYIMQSSGSVQKTVNPYYTYIMPVKAGDKVKISGELSGLSYILSYADTSWNYQSAGTSVFVAPNDGVVTMFNNTDTPIVETFYPADAFDIDYSQIINTPDTQFNGLTGVAFGTSITYRAQSTGGYLQYLPDLSGITFDNQGIGSSTILGNGGNLDLLAAIKAYTGYSGKRVALLEGFVNDWYQDKTLGTWKDIGETTVCGCVRSALNYMLSQNPNMTVFLILDNLGRNYNSVDCSSTAVRTSGLTQYEYYSEIAKVAESLGVPVIRMYAESQISENTPQYLLDNIHPNALGAKQSANFIWSKMRSYMANCVS